ncbi:hypothetical protein C9I98_09650 [Photobacterium sanctipauli]|uniref:Uncharacterized protein n=1 Tax=Photobacterium sanctipauli TaxID=1342794 RepID=A0A2T3NVJ4_9GAMM|nr:hypothetical protein [Photobacterium sanctipauli]PSW20304.1 hypothetical protein C9I98_09650 [Photobacterium sanctipauli]
MDNSDYDGIKRDISLTVHDIFENFEESNNRLPTLEEFRTLFDGHAEQYIGPNDQLKVESISPHQDKHHEREQKLWRAVNELEAEQRFLRSEC